MAEIRAQKVPEELLKRIKYAVVDRDLPSIREAAIEAFETWLNPPPNHPLKKFENPGNGETLPVAASKSLPPEVAEWIPDLIDASRVKEEKWRRLFMSVRGQVHLVAEQAREEAKKERKQKDDSPPYPHGGRIRSK